MKLWVDFHPSYAEVIEILRSFLKNHSGYDAAELVFWLDETINKLREQNEHFFDTQFHDRMNFLLEKHHGQ